MGIFILFSKIILLLFALFFLVASFISFKEKENRASLLFGGLLVLSVAVLFVLLLLSKNIRVTFSLVFTWVTVIATFLILIPIKPKYRQVMPRREIDERDTMFARNELSQYPNRFEAYYKKNPEKKKLDDRFRASPGLLKKGTSQYHPVHFASSASSFETIEALRGEVDGEVADEKLELQPENITRFVKGWAKKLGAVDCGVTELKDYHLYTFGGRADRYGQKFLKTQKYAIAIIVEMSHEIISTAPTSPVVMESAQQYVSAGIIAIQIAKMIRKLGYSSRAHIDGNYQVICPLVAKDAGLGELSRMGILMTPRWGPRVRISVVTTNLPMVVDKPLKEQSMIDFCLRCKKCADACPSKAIPNGDMVEINGIKRWQINQEACFTFWNKIGTDCSKCVQVCPYSHPDNLIHNIVRAGVRHNTLFRIGAIKLDDFFYGRIPRPKPKPSWLLLKTNNRKG